MKKENFSLGQPWVEIKVHGIVAILAAAALLSDGRAPIDFRWLLDIILKTI